jgi:CheY-like chemotaxis protein
VTTVIAVVEDNADNRLLLQAILEGTYEVREYETGEAALAGFRRAPPDVALVDISLPRMSGVDLAREVRRDPALCHLPLIALTAHAMAEDRATYLASGFDAYVTKPIVDESVLCSAIERLAGKPR